MKVTAPIYSLLLISFFAILSFFFSTACSSENTGQVEVKAIEIVKTYPHDQDAFTQGLVFYKGSLFESTGQYGKSSLRKVNLETGKIEKTHKLSDHLFGEGITILGDKIYQLTWRSKKGIVYELDSFNVLEFFNYPFEGWGITNDGKNLIISNGTQNIYFYDPKSYRQLKKIKVTDRGEPVSLINELEFVNGKIYANIWRSDKIISIDPESGKVLDWYDLSALRNLVKGQNRVDVLNGIAYDDINERFFVTGKFWPKLFEIKLD